MKALAIRLLTVNSERIGWALLAAIGTLILARFGISLNQSLAVLFTIIVLLVWVNNKANGLMAALLFFMVKPLFVRLAYAVDKNLSGSGGFDLLGITPALVLAGLVVWHSYLRIASGETILKGKSRTLLVLFGAVAFLSIFNPSNSIILGFGGFERNVLPNMLVLLTASFVFAAKFESKKILKFLLVLGIVSCVYGIGQYFLGLYPWEKDWILDIAFAETESGWLTVGLRGVEFRSFSIFYNYMDFTFCNVLIFALAISFGTTLKGKWLKFRTLYLISWGIVLILSLERTPMMMSALAAFAVYFFNSRKEKRKRIFWKTAGIAAIFLGTLSIAAPYLKETGAHTLIRLAEMTNPLAASSIEDRLNKNWGPTFETIASNPLGVGIGYGSQTRAKSIAERTSFYIEPHNELLQKTLETGVIGGTLYLLLLISVFKNSIRLGRLGNRIRRLGIGFAAVSIGFWLCGMVNVPFSGSSGLLYWAIAGLVIAQCENCLKPPQIPTNKFDQTADNSRS